MKLAAFTIIESMMAMIIVMISFTAGMLVYFSTLQTDAFPLQVKAENCLEKVWVDSQVNDRFLDEQLQVDGFSVQKTVRPYQSPDPNLTATNVYQVQLKAFAPNQQLVSTQNHLVYIQP